MSWDVFVFRCDRAVASVSEMPKHGDPTITIDLGSGDFVRKQVDAVFAGTDWRDPSWGQWSSATIGSVEFSLGRHDQVASAMLHVRAGSEVIAMIVQLCRTAGWQAFDCSTGDLLDQIEHPEQGLAGWQAFRDGVLGSNAE